jgi:hypothetical protein
LATAVIQSAAVEHSGWVVDASIGGIAVAIASEDMSEKAGDIIEVSIKDSLGRACLDARPARIVCAYPHTERGRTILRLAFADESPYDQTEGWIMRALT